MIAYCSNNNMNNNMNNNIIGNMNNNINMLPIIPLLIDPNYCGVDVDDIGNSGWGQFIDLEIDEYNSINNYTSNVKNNITYCKTGSNDYYGNSRFNIVTIIFTVLNFFEKLINFANIMEIE